jgi:23S rRNA (cytidine1920-2'-O)/16S rRNA (cytidine1409-2'-O)-methyltransferase
MRLDRALVERGLADSRNSAVALIEGGRVLVSGSVAHKPARMVASGEPVLVSGPPARFVGRGGDKLAAALERFSLRVAGLTALDAGASTGGFTDCLLQAGAAKVIAVDVGHSQLHHRLTQDRRVVNVERHDIRDVTLATVGGSPVDLVTADLSFISLTRAVPVLTGPVVGPGATIVALVKPQFEAGRVEASRGRGVIRDPVIHRSAVAAVAGALEGAGAAMMGVMPSPITGHAGNVEFLLYAVAHPDDRPARRLAGDTLRAAIDDAVDESLQAGLGR